MAYLEQKPNLLSLLGRVTPIMLGTSLQTAIVNRETLVVDADRVPPARNEDAQGSMTHAGTYLLHPETVLAAVADVNVQNLEDFQQKWGSNQHIATTKRCLAQSRSTLPAFVRRRLPTAKFWRRRWIFSVETIFVEKPISQTGMKRGAWLRPRAGKLPLIIIALE